jgi:uncharacterized membrane protein YhaH (DUF805 family)
MRLHRKEGNGVTGTAKENKSKYWWYILLLVPFIGTLWVPFYASEDPKVWGIPYFYWYQFLWVIISAVLTVIVYYATKPKSGHQE